MKSEDLHRYTVDGVGRIYSNGDEYWPSVSTVLNVKPEPEALKRWRKNTENYEEVMTYKQNRGTIIHADCQQSIMPTDPETGAPIKKLWGKDEEQSLRQVRENGNVNRLAKERDWAKKAWEFIGRVTNFDDVIDVERFVVNTDVGYAGQFDLLYYDHEHDETVLGDIKTGKYVYDKNQIQLSAYANAVPMTIDRVEILRMNPDFADWEVSSNYDWDENLDDLWEKFKGYREELEAEELGKSIQAEIDDGNAMVEGKDDDVGTGSDDADD